MREMGKYHDYLMEELSDREESIAHIQTALEEYQNNGDSFVFLRALRSVVEAQGNSSEFTRQIRTAPSDLLKALSSGDKIDLDTITTILAGLGCCLSVVEIENEPLDRKVTEILNRVACRVRQPNYHLLRANKGTVISESLSRFAPDAD